MNNNEMDTVTLYLEDDSAIECQILCFLKAGNNQYIALLPPEDGEEESPVYLYRYSESDDGEPQIENIVDDEEFEIASDAYDEWLDAQEYEALDLDTLDFD